MKCVCHQRQNLLLFVEKKSQPKVANTLIVVERASDEFQALHLAKCWGVSKHVDVLQKAIQKKKSEGLEALSVCFA